MSSEGTHQSFYENYPSLFEFYFPEIENQTVAELSEAGFAYYQSVINLDAIIDKGEIHRIFKVLDLQENAIRKLSQIFPDDSLFWEFWQQRKAEYKEAITLEKDLFNKYTVEKFTEVADKKSAFGKVAIDSLYVLSTEKDEDLLNKLLESHKYFSVGFQIYDDIIDFREDLNGKQFNIAVHELSKKIDFKQYPEPEKLNKILYITTLGFEILQKSIDNFEKAKTFLPDTESGWYNTIVAMQNSVKTFKENSFAYLENLKKKNELKKIPQKSEFFSYSRFSKTEIKAGLAYIKKQFSENYVELKHFMWLSNTEGFTNKEQLHFSDTFPRAMLNDCLLHISRNLNLKNEAFFREENSYFIKNRNKDEIGAWSYFSTVKEIAADIDDLGQIMQQFVLSNQKNLIDEYCIKAIETAIEDRSVENGGIETWIIPKTPTTENQKTQDFFNTTKWGKGPDVEVVANFLYALFLYDAEKYSSTIKKGIDYIISEQKEKGFWQSRWYYGNFYGTYVCFRLLHCFPTEYLDAKEKALLFIYNAQNENGSFGEDEEHILPTAFARMILLAEPAKHQNILKISKEFLISTQNKDGSWVAENFIKPKASEPYKSKTLSTAFALKSLV